MSSQSKHEPTMVSLSDLVSMALFLLLPYVIVGVIWAASHSTHLQGVHGVDNFFSYLGEIVAWPVLIFSDITLK